MADFSAYDPDDVSAAYAVAARRWHRIVNDPLVAVGYRTATGWAPSTDQPRNESDYERLGAFSAYRLWINVDALDALGDRIEELGGIALVHPEEGQIPVRFRNREHPFFQTPAGDSWINGPLVRSADVALRDAGGALFDFSNEPTFSLFAVLEEFEVLAPGAARPAPLLFPCPWDLGPFGGPRELTPGLTPFTNAAGGNGVTLVVLDSGLSSHPTVPFSNVQAVDPATDVEPSTPPFIMDWEGHGTFVAGIIRQLVHPAVNIRVSDCTIGSSNAIDVPQLFGDLNNAHGVEGRFVVNLSMASTLGSPVVPAEEVLLANFLLNPNVIMVAAAGNENTTVTGQSRIRPGGFDHPRMVSVGATERTKVGSEYPRAAFSNSGDWVKVWTVGRDVVAPFVKGVYNWKENGLPKTSTFQAAPGREMARWSGTSFATPIVAAAIARAWATESSADAAIKAVMNATTTEGPGGAKFLKP